MRLTVHVAEARKETIEVKSKDKAGTFAKKEILRNTLSFTGVNKSDVERILNSIQENGEGIPMKHYLSREKIPGLSRGKRKK